MFIMFDGIIIKICDEVTGLYKATLWSFQL